MVLINKLMCKLKMLCLINYNYFCFHVLIKMVDVELSRGETHLGSQKVLNQSMLIMARD